LVRSESAVIDSALEESPTSAVIVETEAGPMGTSGVVARDPTRAPEGGRELLDALPASLLLLDETLHVALANRSFRDELAELDLGCDVGRFFPRLEVEAAVRQLRSGASRLRINGTGMTRRGPLSVALDLSLLSSEGREYLCVACQPSTEIDPSIARAEPGQAVPPALQLAVVQRQEVSANLALSVAHEINNMLSVIMASAELAGRVVERAQDPLRDLERVEEASQRAARVLGDFLYFLGQSPTAEEDLEPAEVIRDMSRLLDRSVRRGITLRLLLEPTRPVRVVRATLEASVLSLVDNARDALGGQGDVALVCQERPLTREEAQLLGVVEGPFVSIGVTDNGPGMSHDLVRDAQLPYFTTKGLGASTGLGLTAVSAFARAAGGCLLLSSEPGQGTTAEILLPLV
jgi:signal transduction histidine kinase